MVVRSCFVAMVVGLLGCSSATTAPSAPLSVTKSIGPEGGSIVVEGATVTFPKDALSAATMLTITATNETPPDGFVALSRVYKCEPAGTNFAQMVTMAMTFTGDDKPASILWSTGADPTFMDLGGTPTGSTITTSILHFSRGFVGRKK